MVETEPLYLGFDLSTQQLKGLAVTSDLKVVYEAKFDFDIDSRGFDVEKGVQTNEEEREVFAPIALWLQALDGVLQRLQAQGIDFRRVRAISGAGQQHGSVYWSEEGEKILQSLDKNRSLEEQLVGAFSYPFSPNWQDASTQRECDAFDEHLGGAHHLALITGSKAHHRFTGPQILRFRHKHPDEYQRTSRISLVSSFLASIFLGKVASIDRSDVCGMNLWDIEAGTWREELLSLTAGSSNTTNLKCKLGSVPEDGGGSLGIVSPYFTARYNIPLTCTIAPFTGDNPSTILALPLRPLDAIVSLGTSTTFLMSTPRYVPDPSVHFMNHPTTSGLYMFMLCYKNGGLAREQIRDALPHSDKSWDTFNAIALNTPALGQNTPNDSAKLALFFPRPEIVPNVPAGTWHYTYSPTTYSLSSSMDSWSLPYDNPRAILESQLLSLRFRSQNLVSSPQDFPDVPPQPRRIYLVGGGSYNDAIAEIAGEVLGGVEGVYRLDVGGNACALGAAYKAVWAVERKEEETFEELVGARWREEEFVKKVAEGYQRGVFEKYKIGVEGLEAVEKEVLRETGRRKW